MFLPAHDIVVAGLSGEFCDMDRPIPSFVKSCKHGGTGRIAFGHVIESGEPYAFPSQAVDIGCPDLSSVATDVREADIIPHDEDNIGPGGRFPGTG